MTTRIHEGNKRIRMKPRSQKSAVPAERIPIEDEEEEILPDHRFVRSASMLDDYLDEEVVDRRGRTVGTLSCYWEADDGSLAFCGIQTNGGDEVRIVPGDGAQVSERHAWVRVCFPASRISTAPVYHCEEELNPTIERTVYEHYRLHHTQPHSRLKYLGSH